MKKIVSMCEIFIVGVASCSAPDLEPAPTSAAALKALKAEISSAASRSNAFLVSSLAPIPTECLLDFDGGSSVAAQMTLISACGVREADHIVPCSSDVVVLLDPAKPFSRVGTEISSVAFLRPIGADISSSCGARYVLGDVYRDGRNISVTEAQDVVLDVPSPEVSPFGASELWRPETDDDDE
ncbi:MAG TPA: hypothetical protein VGF99_10390 [Myxococcota bacterium]